MKNKGKEQAESKMFSRIKVGIYRRLDDRFEGFLGGSPQKLELHNRRKEALHEVFDTQKSVEALNLGKTEDTKSHEFVEIVLGAVAVPVFQYAWFRG